ncbi:MULTISPECIES: ArsR/SmtB family transcription factor [Burkholderia]|uniref:ArsR family transcriptional regulator n=1 Tax=Burkholderia aenigmatica TaxID=2015348 RepID=A0ABY6XRN4_9BURK|nr:MULTISPECIES: helix-turn-helix domain-containing protein [Burkholderia]AYQ44278.1 transcriptional regulator [Burkholderia lata]MCA8299685.1 helix-turn-helix domain-containing protein [Burkholderia sp. AU30198]VWC68334.1 ArsR family transcriptional regulator [Burkholderia aenigmatica]VWC92918.1 ArsR family transcriptional regulator [Burkholderia aenigmatica]
MIDVDLAHKALAHPFRRNVLRWLKSPDTLLPDAARLRSPHGVPLSSIVTRSGLSQSTVSAHVAVLCEAGLIVATQVGQWRFVARDDAGIAAFVAQVIHDL